MRSCFEIIETLEYSCNPRSQLSQTGVGGGVEIRLDRSHRSYIIPKSAEQEYEPTEKVLSSKSRLLVMPFRSRLEKTSVCDCLI